MAFTEKLKKQVRDLADGKCVICHEPFVEIHHIVPQSEGGEDTLANAAPLCAGCHDRYGDSPSKRKQIIEFRERWYKVIQNYPMIKPKKIIKEKQIGLYHIVYEDENFEQAANDIIEILVKSQKEFPNKPRILYLDIEGHRNQAGGFDHDMFELMAHFILGNVMKYFTEVHLPLLSAENDKGQDNTILFDDLKIYPSGSFSKELEGKLFMQI